MENMFARIIHTMGHNDEKLQMITKEYQQTRMMIEQFVAKKATDAAAIANGFHVNQEILAAGSNQKIQVECRENNPRLYQSMNSHT